MKSGDFSVSHHDDDDRESYAEITDREFVRETFRSRPALIAKESVNGHRMWKDYHGEPFDEKQFDLVEGKWDHEHCSVCFFTITEGYTYWANTGRVVLLCDACHEAMEDVPPAAK